MASRSQRTFCLGCWEPHFLKSLKTKLNSFKVFCKLFFKFKFLTIFPDMGKGQRITSVSLLLSATVATALEHPVTPNWRIESKIQNHNFISQKFVYDFFGDFFFELWSELIRQSSGGVNMVPLWPVILLPNESSVTKRIRQYCYSGGILMSLFLKNYQNNVVHVGQPMIDS